MALPTPTQVVETVAQSGGGGVSTAVIVGVLVAVVLIGGLGLFTRLRRKA